MMSDSEVFKRWFATLPDPPCTSQGMESAIELLQEQTLAIVMEQGYATPTTGRELSRQKSVRCHWQKLVSRFTVQADQVYQ